MTSTGPLDAATLQSLVKALGERRAELVALVARSSAAERSNDSTELPDPAEQSADRVLAAEFRELSESVTIKHADELREIEGALARVEEGNYGECETCGEPIGVARLRAYPMAVRCVGCQTRAERGTGGHARL